jgi:two-component system chemotaxis response regulator CheB
MAENELNHQSELLVIGGSAGSLEVVLPLIERLKEDFKIPVVIVMHRKGDAEELLTGLIKLRTKLKVKEAEEKEPLKPSTIYIAPADYHLLIEKDKTFSLDFSEKVNYSRPSIDVTFETAADVYRDKTAALLLSGANEDGVKGLKLIEKNGGLTMVQEPSTAAVPYMPEKALEQVEVDYVLTPDQMPGMINSFEYKTDKEVI